MLVSYKKCNDGACPLMEEYIAKVLISKEELGKRVAELGAEITRDYEGKKVLVLGILKGAVPFMADLIREIKLPLAYDFMALSSYGTSTQSSGVVRILKDIGTQCRRCPYSNH